MNNYWGQTRNAKDIVDGKVFIKSTVDDDVSVNSLSLRQESSGQLMDVGEKRSNFFHSMVETIFGIKVCNTPELTIPFGSSS